MVSTKIIMLKKPRLKNPIFIEGLPGVGNVGRIAAGYLVEELGAKKFAELYSPHFMPFVLLHQTSEIHMLRNEFYYWKGKKNEIGTEVCYRVYCWGSASLGCGRADKESFKYNNRLFRLILDYGKKKDNDTWDR